MLYLGFFSFEVHGNRPQHGYLTGLVDADGLDGALNQFHDLFNRVQKEENILLRPATVYLDVVIQIKGVPPDGLVTHLVRREGELAPALSISLPGDRNGHGEAFSEVPESFSKGRASGEAFAVAPEMSDRGEVEIKPFLRFE